jgi:hypothetical protein
VAATAAVVARVIVLVAELRAAAPAAPTRAAAVGELDGGRGALVLVELGEMHAERAARGRRGD